MVKVSAVFFLILLFSLAGAAEYRVFTLHIINNKSKTTRQVETTLDPIQYSTFYPLRADEEISYIETWRCIGRTDFFKSHCDNPRLNTGETEKPVPKSEARLD